jgi:hypothetical protein
MVRLQGAEAQERFGPLRERGSDQEFEFAGFIATDGEPSAVVTLDPKGGTPECFGEPGHGLKGRG